ncbi:MAG: hypothetical protein JSV16_05125, partial [Candidatus Hydrogenedentota bacterium]
MTSLSFRCVSASLGVEIFIKLIAPFYPTDEKLSIAPFFYIDLVCKPAPKAEERIAGDIMAALLAPEDAAITREGSGVVLRRTYRMTPDVPCEEADEFSRGDFAGAITLVPIRGKMTLRENTFSIPYSVDEGTETRATFVLAAHCDEPILRANGTPHRFRYLRWFPNLAEVAAYARDEEAEIVERVNFFDELFLRCSTGHCEKNLIAYSFQSHLSTTWWTEPASGGPDWFGSWDSQALHNSMESEYASSLLYLNLWPDLLERQLDQRASFEKETGYLPATCGRFLSLQSSGQRAAGVEEACDYLLMMFAHWRWWNRFEPIKRQFPLIRRLGNLLLCSEPVQPEHPHGRAHTEPCLMLKTLCALEALAIMADELEDGDLSESCSRSVKALRTKLEERARPGDHFNVGSGNGGQDAAENRRGPTADEDDRYSIHTLKGLLHHLMCDSFPELDYGLLRQDTLSSATHTLSDYGCASAGAGRDKFSISQNIWRDITAAYLGINFALMAERYWSFQVLANVNGCGGCYVDSHDSRNLACDPRGA